MTSILSIKARLSLLFVLIFGGCLIAYGVYIYRTVDSVFQSEFDVLLYEFGMEVGDSINYSFLGDIRVDHRVFADDRKIFPFSMKEAVIQIRAKNGALLAKSKALREETIPLSEIDLQRIHSGRYFFADWLSTVEVAGNTKFRLLNYQVVSPRKPQVIVQVAVPDRFVRENNKRISQVFFYSIPIVLLVSAILGYSYAGFALLPVNRIIDRVRAIKANDLSQRVPVPGAKDELNLLASTINQMLERVEKAFYSQERFVSDASHQLKTPLTVLKGELELLHKQANRSTGEAERVQSLREEVDFLIDLVNNLLLLARVDVGEQTLVFDEIQMDEVVSTALSRIGPLAKAKQITMKMDFLGRPEELGDFPFRAHGDYDLLISMLQSLLENAVKYSPVGSSVQVNLGVSEDEVVVTILDEGPGIQEPEMERIFERFHRGSYASRSVSGSGLGLSIARRIADLHASQLSVTNRNDTENRNGVEVTVRIKKV